MGMYDYEHDLQYSSPKNPREKKITVKMNLNSTHMCVIKYTKNEIPKLSHFKKKINSSLNLGMQNYQDIRCFNLEGQEQCEEDFEFLKNDGVDKPDYFFWVSFRIPGRLICNKKVLNNQNAIE